MKNFNMFLIVLGMMLFLPLKGLAMGNNPKTIEKIKEDYSKLNLTDGVSKQEALIIAKHFVINDPYNLSAVVMSSGKVMESGYKDLKGNCWAVIFDAKLKVKWQTGLLWFEVHIDKVSGMIKVQGWGPS